MSAGTKEALILLAEDTIKGGEAGRPRSDQGLEVALIDYLKVLMSEGKERLECRHGARLMTFRRPGKGPGLSSSVV